MAMKAPQGRLAPPTRPSAALHRTQHLCQAVQVRKPGPGTAGNLEVALQVHPPSPGVCGFFTGQIVDKQSPAQAVQCQADKTGG